MPTTGVSSGKVGSAEGVQQILAAGQFSFQPLRCVVRRDLAVFRRIPYLIVDAVQNAVKILRPAAQHTVQAVTELRCLDLFGVPAAYRGDGIGIDNAPLEKIEGAIVLGPLHRVHIPRQQQLFHCFAGKPSLAIRAMDGQQAGDILQRRIEVVHRP